MQCGRPGFDPWVGKILWRRVWLPTPVFLPRKSHGQRNLEGYSAWGCKESDMTERLAQDRDILAVHVCVRLFGLLFLRLSPPGGLSQHPCLCSPSSSLSFA